MIEMIWRNSKCVALPRLYFVFLQGTWLCQVAVMIYNPFQRGNISWEMENKDHMTQAVVLFSFHMGGVFLLMLFIGTFVFQTCQYKCNAVSK